MMNAGFHPGFIIAQLINLVLIIAWLVLVLIALFSLKRRNLSASAKGIWALLIMIVPLMGAISYFIIQPTDPNQP
ncbi:MAG: PLDc N-terminal domain-containing protein [Anaerolineae bacterium]|nr:PLDc N-terminal domain-containing protein [Anaerolineae bacterium]